MKVPWTLNKEYIKINDPVVIIAEKCCESKNGVVVNINSDTYSVKLIDGTIVYPKKVYVKKR